MIFRSPYHKTRTSFYSHSLSIIGCSFSHIYLSSFIMFNCGPLILRLLSFIPSFIKIPSPPSSYWSPEVHCEVNTSTSLFSAGPSSKLGVHGILRFIPNRLSLFIYFISCFVICFSLLGIFIVLGRSSRCLDIKKIIGFSPISHSNSISVIVFLINHFPLLSGIITPSSHGSCSVGSSSIRGILINKSYPRHTDRWHPTDFIYLFLLVLLLSCNSSSPAPMNPISEPSCLIVSSEIDCFSFLRLIRFPPLPHSYFSVLFNRFIPIIYYYYLSSSSIIPLFSFIYHLPIWFSIIIFIYYFVNIRISYLFSILFILFICLFIL